MSKNIGDHETLYRIHCGLRTIINTHIPDANCTCGSPLEISHGEPECAAHRMQREAEALLRALFEDPNDPGRVAVRRIIRAKIERRLKEKGAKMPFGRDEAHRRAAGRKHAEREHKCPICGRVVRGNGYYGHRKACRRKHCKTYLRFECGARLPAQGYLPYRWEKYVADVSSSGPREDGRYKYVCVDTESDANWLIHALKEPGSILRPIMPDGKDAPCLFRCPCPEHAGREEAKCWPESEERKEKLRKCREAKDYGSQWDLWRFIVTCYPEEIDDSATPRVAGATGNVAEDVNHDSVSRGSDR